MAMALAASPEHRGPVRVRAQADLAPAGVVREDFLGLVRAAVGPDSREQAKVVASAAVGLPSPATAVGLTSQTTMPAGPSSPANQVKAADAASQDAHHSLKLAAATSPSSQALEQAAGASHAFHAPAKVALRKRASG